MKRILVTGATGFIGHSLCSRLLSEGLGVRGTIRSIKQLDRLPYGIDATILKSIDANSDWSKALIGVDVIVHLAARVHIMRESLRYPIAEYSSTNIDGTMRLAAAARDQGVSRFIFISTAGVHGNITSIKPFTEDDIPVPHDDYSRSKWEAEQALSKLDSRDMKVVVLRPPLVYGRNVPGNFARLLSIVDRGLPLPFGSIKNARSMVYVENLVDAIVHCASVPLSEDPVFLVSDGEDISTPELLRVLGELIGKGSVCFQCPKLY